MKQLEFKPAVDFEQYGKIPLKESLSVNLPEKDSTGYNLLINSKKTSEVQEKKPIGIETSMVYIAVPVSVTVWISIIYFVRMLFF